MYKVPTRLTNAYAKVVYLATKNMTDAPVSRFVQNRRVSESKVIKDS